MTLERSVLKTGLGLATATALLALTLSPAFAATKTYDINTLAGKVASVNGTSGLGIRMSAFLQEEAADPGAPVPATTAITPTNVLTSPLDGTSITGPNVTVNQDTNAAPQNETSIAVDPNNASRLVAGANDYVTRTWSCTISGTPCSALGDGYSGTYFSNDGGAHWCCTSSDPSNIGTLIPGVEHLVGGPYDAGGDPSVAFDSKGNVFYAGLGFDRASAPSTVEVSRGTFPSGHLSWGAPTWINATTSPSTLNDKEWIAVDSHIGSPFQDRIYVTWTRFKFNGHTGAYTQSPIAFVSSSDGGATFTTPKLISGNVLYGQGSHPVVGPDGTLYVFWDGSTRLAQLDSTYMVKSTDGGATWSKPLAISTLSDTPGLRSTAFRVNSFPAAAANPSNGDLYATWAAEVPNNNSTYAGTTACAYFLNPGFAATCHSAAVYSKSTDGGATWSAPDGVFTPGGNRTAVGYPVTQPPTSAGCPACDGSTLNAPNPLRRIEDIFPSAAVSANGNVYLGAYRGLTVSPWQTCANAPVGALGRITCPDLGPYIDNTRLDYVVRDLTTDATRTVTTHPINSRYGFGGTFFGDYTDMAVDSDGNFHALYTDSNNVQNVTWFYGLLFDSTPIHQQDIATATGNY
jgi:hypothetical protein